MLTKKRHEDINTVQIKYARRATVEEIIGKIRIKWGGEIHSASVTGQGKLILEGGQELTVAPDSMKRFREKMIPVERKNKGKKDKDEVDVKKSFVPEVLFRMLVIVLLCVQLILSLPQRPATAENGIVTVLRAAEDITKGTRITGDMLTGLEMLEDRYRVLSSGIYLTSEGSSVSDAVVLLEDSESVVGCYATRNMLRGEPLTVSGISFSAPPSGAGFVQVEVNGKIMDIPLDASLFGNGADTRVDILAVFSEDGNEGQTRALLASFTMEDRQLKQIYTRAGEGIMEGLENAREK